MKTSCPFCNKSSKLMTLTLWQKITFSSGTDNFIDSNFIDSLYSIVKDSNGDLGVIFRFLQNSPITNAVCTKMSEFFFEFLAILWYLLEKIKRLYWGSQQSRSNFYSWESMLRVSTTVWHYFLKVSDEIEQCRFVHFDLSVQKVPGPMDQCPLWIQFD